MDFTPKTLPMNLEAEQAVLAAVLMDARAFDSITDFLLPEHFSHPAHQEIYKLAYRHYASSMPFDIITAKNYLLQQGTLDSVGGVEYLSKLLSAGSTVVNVEHYARIVFDNARRRDLIRLGQNIIDEAYTENPDNPVNSQIETTEQKLFNLSFTGKTDKNTVTLAEALKSAMSEIQSAYRGDGKLTGLTTGLDDLDTALSGLHHSDLVILAGRPAMGKTTLGMNIAFNAANAIHNKRANDRYKGAVVFFSLEMSNAQLAMRIASSQSKVPLSSMRNGNLSDEDVMKVTEYVNALSQLPLVIDDAADMSVPMLKTRVRHIARKYGGVALIVIDYLQLMTSPGGKRNENRVQELSEITRGLKILAKDMDVPVIALSQLSRMVESRDDKRPQLSDLRESGSIEQDADIVMFLYRPKEDVMPDQKDDKSKRIINCSIAKNRSGMLAKFELLFHGPTTTFHNITERDEE